VNFLKAFSIFVFCVTIVTATNPPTGFCRKNESPQPSQIKTFEDGIAYKTRDNIYWVLSLKGSWRDMGRQYGGLVREDLRQFYQEITEDVTVRGIDKKAQIEVAKQFADGLSHNLHELLRGIAETSGLDENEILLLNAGMLNLSGAVLGAEPHSACSGIAAWKNYTPDHTMVFGRNWDIDRKSMKKYMKYLSVVVFNPDLGNGFANIHPLGNVYLETGMNSKGLFLELNNGLYSDANMFEERENTVSTLVSVLNQCSSIDAAADYLSGVPGDLSYIIQIADAQDCVSVERPTFGARIRRSEQPGILAAYNSFVPPYPKEWEGKATQPRSPKEDPRYQNLLSLANSKQFYGKLDVERMKKLMEIQMEDGGATHKGTVLQVIAVPKDLTLWIRGMDYSDWQEVNLKNLFIR